MEDKRVKFLKVFANLPEYLREDILVVINNKPYTWNSAYIEIKDKTRLGEEILKTLKELDII